MDQNLSSPYPAAGRADWSLPDPVSQPEYYAGVPLKRLFAWVVDAILVCLVTAVVVLFTVGIALFFLPLVYLSVDFVYRWITISSGSATPGMRLMGIELRNRYGRRFDAGTAFLHTLGFTITSAFFLPQLLSMVLMATQERGQGLTDLVLGTTAINRAG